MNVDGTINVSHALAGVFILGMIVGFGAGVVSPVQLENTGSPNDDTKNQPKDTDRTFTTEGEPVLGDEDAPVTMVIFEDFECPFCKRFEEGAFPRIKEEYVDTGKVKVVWKDYPLTSLHPWARPSAEAMECVYRQDEEAFWPIKSKIFDNQRSIDKSNVQSKIISWAAEEGISESDMQTCLEQDSVSNEIDEDMKEGGKLGTPTSFINGQKMGGAQPFSRFEQVIESELNNQ